MTSRKRPRGRDDDSGHDFADPCIEGEFRDSGDPPPIKKPKKWWKTDAKASQSNTSAVQDGASPPTVDSKLSSKPQAPDPKRSLSFSNAAPESSIVMRRLKDLCSMKEPTVNVGIEIVGAAYLLKVMTDRGSCNDKIGLAVEQAVEATKQLFRAEHDRKYALQKLSESQKNLFDEFL